MKRCLLATFSLAAVLGCASPEVTDLGVSATPTPAPTPSATPNPAASLSAGNYDYVIKSVPTNTCWGSKNQPAVPTTVTATLAIAGSTVTVDTTMNGTPQTSTLTLSNGALTGGGSGDADLSPQGIACTIHVDSTFNGSVTGNDAFSAVQTVDVKIVSGTGCDILVGSLSSQQFDTLPCSITLDGDGTKH